MISVQKLALVGAFIVAFIVVATSLLTNTARVIASPKSSGEVVFTNPNPDVSPYLSKIWLFDTSAAATTPLTTTDPIASFPAISPDGSKIAYIGGGGSVAKLHIMNISATQDIIVPVNGHSQRPAWSPDGQMLAFANDSVDWWEIWVVNLDGSNARRLTTTSGPAGYVTWSPDANQIAFAAGGATGFDLETVDITGTNQSVIFSSAATGRSYHTPAWTPDGTQIAVMRWPANNDSASRDLWLMNLNGTTVRRLASNIDPQNNPTWSKDGNWIVFGKGGNIWRVRRDGIGLIQLTRTGAWEPSTSVDAFPAPQLLYFPLFANPIPINKGIYGHVTDDGTDVSGIGLELRFYDGANWSTQSSQTTGADGSYSFMGLPSLGSGQHYYVRYRNTPATSTHLWFWGTRTLDSYAANSEVAIGDFDIADISLQYPAAGANNSLPTTFQWTRRSATPSDSYALTLYDPQTRNPFAQTSQLGYVDNFTLNSLASGFTTGTTYVWEVWAFSPDSAYGISFESRPTSFSATTLVVPKGRMTSADPSADLRSADSRRSAP